MSLVSGDEYIDSLVQGSWNTRAGVAVSLTYSFPTAAPTDYAAANAQGFVPMTAAQQAGAIAAMATWSAVANITFTQVASGGQIEFGTTDQGKDSNGIGYIPNGHTSTLYVFTNNSDDVNNHFNPGGYGLSTLIHEVGHTLGFKHPGEYGGNTTGPYLPDQYDTRDYSIMAYANGYGYAYDHSYAATPMVLDIEAIQYLYGANMSYHAGNDVYRFVNATPSQCIWDAGGSNTFDFTACTGTTLIDLREGGLSSTTQGYYNVGIAFDVVIGKAIAGNGGSYIYGNDSGDVIQGGTVSDVVHEGAGSDTITGGGGDDTVVFGGNIANFVASGTRSALTLTGEGTDVLHDIAKLTFADRTIEISDYAVFQGGTAGDNVFFATKGNELVTGGAGLDSDNFSGSRADYQITADGAEFTVTDNVRSGGTDLLVGIERVKFADGSAVALDIDGAAGQAYRLYQAAFNRKPDAGGVGFWLDQLDHGLALQKMAQFFLDSPESAATYGKLDDNAFVNLIYANVLHRAPDASGLKFYLDGFSAGSFTRAQVLEGFSESPENHAALIGAMVNGIDYTPVT
jgi:hypothetical protein